MLSGLFFEGTDYSITGLCYEYNCLIPSYSDKSVVMNWSGHTNTKHARCLHNGYVTGILLPTSEDKLSVSEGCFYILLYTTLLLMQFEQLNNSFASASSLQCISSTATQYRQLSSQSG